LADKNNKRKFNYLSVLVLLVINIFSMNFTANAGGNIISVASSGDVIYKPEATSLTLTPSDATPGVALTASYTFVDKNGRSEVPSSRQVRWYRNSVLDSGHNNLLTLPASVTADGELWYYTLQVSDGLLTSDIYTSPSVLVTSAQKIQITVSPNITLGYNQEELGVQLDYDDWKHITGKASGDYTPFLQAMNVKIIRVFVYRQNNLNPNSVYGPCSNWDSSTHTGTWNWDNMDLVVNTIRSMGAEPLLVLMHPWSTLPFPRNPTGMSTDPNTLLPYPDDWGKYCAEWVKHYGNKVKYYEVMNEPYQYWHWSPDTVRLSQLMALYSSAYNAMKAINPNLIISHDAVMIKDVLKYQKENNIPFDTFDFHGYGGSALTDSDSTIFDMAGTYLTKLSPSRYTYAEAESYYGKDLPIIDSETNFSWAVSPPDTRNQLIDGAVFNALQLIIGAMKGVSYRIHYIVGSTAGGWGFINSGTNTPFKTYYVYKLFGQNLFKGDVLIQSLSASSDVVTLSWKHGGVLYLMAVNKGVTTQSLTLSGMTPQSYTLIDSSNNELVGSYSPSVVLPSYSIILFKSVIPS